MIVLVANEKGGVGKTTLSANIASLVVGEGRDALLVDADRRAAASGWAGLRHEGEVMPRVPCVTKHGRIGHDLTLLREKFDTIIVDCGGQDSLEMRQALLVCDVVLVPIKPADFDVWSLATMATLIDEACVVTGRRIRANAVINLANPNPKITEAADVRRSVEAEYADILPLLKVTVYERIAIRHAAREGRGVCELPRRQSDPTAVEEMRAVYREVVL